MRDGRRPTGLDREQVVAEAVALGFDMAGVATGSRSRHFAHFRRWTGAGLHGEMGYLARPDALARRRDLKLTLDGFRSAVVVAHSYADADPAAGAGDPSQAVVARYARGRDYHHVVAERLEALGERLEEVAGTPVRRRAYVDAGPVLERDLARRAGLGWFGRNTMLIHPRRGSYFFLGVLLTDLRLQPSAPFREDHCGSCRRCLDACPTGALLGRDENGAPVMDARRCISYLTIELRGTIPRELRPAIGARVFGCDICQETCPWNERFAAPTPEPLYEPRRDLERPALLELASRLLALSGKGFQREFAGSPLLRAGRKGMLRNVCVALGNWGAPEAAPTLAAALSDPAAVVRAHAAWALGRVGSAEAAAALGARREVEADPEVLDEITAALGEIDAADAKPTQDPAPTRGTGNNHSDRETQQA